MRARRARHVAALPAMQIVDAHAIWCKSHSNEPSIRSFRYLISLTEAPMPLLDQLMQSLGPEAIQAISRKLGTDPSATGGAVSAALPALLGALAQNASTPAGANALDSALESGHDGSVLSDVPGAVQNFENGPGAGILSHVLGNRQDAMAVTLGQVAGLDSSKAGALLTMLAPIVMGALGNARRTDGLDAGGLAS